MSLNLIDWAQTQADRFRLYRTGGFTRAEARHFLELLRELSPVLRGTLRDSWEKRRNQVLSRAPHARIQDKGGTVKARTKDLFVPLRPGIDSRTGGLFTVQGKKGRYVFDRATRRLVALRLKQVTLRGHGYLDKAEARQLSEGERRAVQELVQLSDPTAPMPPSVRERNDE